VIGRIWAIVNLFYGRFHHGAHAMSEWQFHSRRLPIRQFWIHVQYYPLQASGPTPFFFKKFSPPEDPQNKSENYCPATQGIVTSLGEGIKGRPIHPLEGSCAGYPLIPYLAASDACSGCCVNPAAKKAVSFSAPNTRLAPIMLIHCPHEFQAAPLAQHGRGIHEQAAPTLFCW
jgi:hypothetical protein